MNTPLIILAASALFLLALGAAVVLTRWDTWMQKEVLGGFQVKKKALLTGNELEFFGRIRQSLDSKWICLPQVCMGAILDTTLTQAQTNFWLARNQFAAKICDFVVCDAKTLEVKLIVELDDITHSAEKDKRRDQVTAQAGYKTLRYWSRDKPSVQKLKQDFASNLI